MLGLTDDSFVLLVVRDEFLLQAIDARNPARHAIFPLRLAFDYEDRAEERLGLAAAFGVDARVPDPGRLRYHAVVVYARLRATRIRLASVLDADFPWLIDNGLLWQCAPPYTAARAFLMVRKDLAP